MVKYKSCISIAAKKKVYRCTVLETKRTEESKIKAVNLARVIYRVSHETTQNKITTHIPSHAKSSYAFSTRSICSSLAFRSGVISSALDKEAPMDRLV